MKRRTRIDRLNHFVSPKVRFIWGVLLIFSLAFLTSWEERSFLALMGLVLAVLSGKRLQFLYFIFLISTVVFFHLLMPFGKILTQWGPFLITEGALKEGVNKGITLCALVFFSLFSVNKNLQLPGAFGQLWSMTFQFYERLLEEKKSLKLGYLLLSLDRLLERLFPTCSVTIEKKELHSYEYTRTRLWGWIFIFLSAVVTVIVWLFFHDKE